MDQFRSDIHVNRGDFIEKDRRQLDQEEQLIQARKDNVNLVLYIQTLERQLQRILQLNPSAYDIVDDLQKDQLHEEDLTDKQKEHTIQMSQLLSNSTLIKSYESINSQYEQELEKKNSLIKDMEKELQQIQYENTNLSQQLYNLKFNVPQAQATAEKEGDKGYGEKNALVELIKRNHDVVLEKYEIQRQRNELLEKTSFEKEKLYNEIKLENDSLANSNYKLQRQNEDLINEKKILESKLKNSEINYKSTQEDLKILRSQKETLENQVRLLEEQLDVLQKSYEELSSKKQTETDLVLKEVNSLTTKEKDLKQKLIHLERELNETKDQLRVTSQELDARTRENDHLVSLLEDQEHKISLYEQKEKSIQQLAQESKKRIEESNSERDRVLLKEQQYLRQISRLEDQLKTDLQQKTERNEKLIESLRAKHKNLIDSKDDEISDLRLKLSDAKESSERFRIEKDSYRNELDKLLDQVRVLKDEQSLKYEAYSKQINQSETKNDEKIRNLQRDTDILKEENEGLRRNNQQTQVHLHEVEVKLDGYMRDYERYYEENKRLRELINTLREEKDIAQGELKRLKNVFHDRVNEINDECNLKIAHAENQLLETKERYKYHEEKSYEIMMMQERIGEKWKSEHASTVQFFERQIKGLKVENKGLHDKIIELKGLMRLEKENSDMNQKKKRESGRSKEREDRKAK